MFGVGFAMVPLYNLFCRVAGLQSIERGYAVAQDDAALRQTTVIDDRWITVKFDATISSGLPWEFRPVLSKLKVHPGELNEVQFIARNLADETVVGQAIPSIVPWQANEFFKKTECFCFQQQTLTAGEERTMTLRFIVLPHLPDEYDSLTLSYTFMNTDAEAAKKRS